MNPISHISQKLSNGDKNHCAYFNQDGGILYQNEKGELHQSTFGNHTMLNLIKKEINLLREDYFMLN